MNAACVPTCLKCRLAENCAMWEPPKPPQAPEWPDRLTGKFMKCGCRVPILPLVLGLVNPSHVMCDKHGWQPLPVWTLYQRMVREEANANGSAQEKIPF